MAHAKVNLSLAVNGLRSDGFHEICSWVTPIDWHDEVIIRHAERFSLEVLGRCEGVPSDSRNLVWRAAGALAAAAQREPDVSITLHKHLPHGAGLGGGSSDAAATLLALADLWGLDWPMSRLVAIAATLGSDVPFFMYNASAVIRGRGEIVEPVGQSPEMWLVLAMPAFASATPDVYRAWDELVTPPSTAQMPWRKAFGSAATLAESLFNDLEPAAFSFDPRLADLHRRLDRLAGRSVRMTGSGSAFFSLFDTRGEAVEWASTAAPRAGPDVAFEVVRTL